MPIYDCPIIGEGTEGSPLRPSITSLPDIGRWETVGEVFKGPVLENRVKVKTIAPINLSNVQNVYLVEV